MIPTLPDSGIRSEALERAVDRASGHLLGLQGPEGLWCGLLSADTTLESDYILVQLWLHPPRNGVWNPPTRPLIDRAVESILHRQLPGGGFNICVKGPADVSATVKAYFALKVAGIPVDDPRMVRARDCIRSLGGIQAANSYVKLNLGLFDLYPREHAPTVPPEFLLLDNLLYEISSWTRAIVVSLAIVHAHNPRRPVPAGFHLSELFIDGAPLSLRRSPQLFSWRNFFLAADVILKWWEKHGSQWIRRRALRKAERWMVERLEGSDGLGAIYPPMMYAIMALDVLGYPPDHPTRVEAVRQFDNLLVNDGRASVCGETFFFQPCFSPIWDTSIAAFALGEAGRGERLRDAARWMLSKEIRRKGDWAVKRPGVTPSGWAFEFNNEFYPDIDDTAMVLLALRHAKSGESEMQEACQRRAIDWLLAMQSKDGGWAAFDADNNWEFLSDVPFADHNAMLDPTCPDITGRVMEALCVHGLGRGHKAIGRAVGYLKREQLADGSWYGRWGVAYIYGTCFALRGLRAAGEAPDAPHMRRASAWIRSVQNADGGWGEDTQSYNQNRFIGAVSTPSQTAWAVLGLIAAGDGGSAEARRGMEYLIRTQRSDGNWNEELATGTGFPGVFYLNYHLYRLYFPLLALATYANLKDEPALERL